MTTRLSWWGTRAGLLLVASCLLMACTGDDRPVVVTEPVSSGSVTQTISAPAVVQAADRQPVTASVPGVVARIAVEDGESVEAGDLVVRLTSDDVDQALEQAEAAEAALGATQPSIQIAPPGDAAVAASRESVGELDADIQPDLRAARRKARALADADQRKAARATIALLEAAYHDVREALLAAGAAAAAQQNAVAASFSSALDQALRQVTAGQATQAANAADAAAARADDLRLTAPFDGVVQLGDAGGGAAPEIPDDLSGGSADALAGGIGTLDAEDQGRLRVGSPVSPGQTVFTVFDLSELYVQADVDEIDAPQLDVGQSADVLLDAFPDRVFAGEVESVAIEAQTSTTGGVAYPTRIRLLDPPRRNRPRLGMTASAEITTDTVQTDLAVPSRSIVRRRGGQAVFVVREDAAVLVPVSVRALGEELAAVDATGLRRDDQVIVSGYEDLSDGDAVSTQD